MARYGGSLSGEHGDGRARSELLATMYSADAIALFERVKGLFDPDDVLNPGVLVRPAPLDADVRVAAARAATGTGLALAYSHDGGDFSAAVHRCTGVGKCRADLSATGGVMCPSYPATREEKDTTRGRARVLQEMLAPGGPVHDWRSPEVHEALDLCLSCKGCSRDCPTGRRHGDVQGRGAAPDLPAPAAAAVALRARAGCRAGPTWPRGRPRAGQRRDWARGSAAGSPAGRPAWTSAATLPTFAPRTFRQQWAARPGRRRPTAPPVALWVDSFTDHFAPAGGASRPCGCWRPPATACRCPATTPAAR